MMLILRQKNGLVQEINNYFLKSNSLYSHPSGPQYFPTYTAFGLYSAVFGAASANFSSMMCAAHPTTL
jgi:hypothetical protein